MLSLTCSLVLRLAAVPLGRASFAGGDQDAGRGGHHQPMATCSAQDEICQQLCLLTNSSERSITSAQCIRLAGPLFYHTVFTGCSMP